MKPNLQDRRDQPGLLGRLFGVAFGGERQLAFNRQGGGANAKINPHAPDAWRQRVLTRVAEEKAALAAWDRQALD